MIQSLRHIKNRIRGIENLKKVTHAMEMISIAKLRPLESRILSFREYLHKTEGLLQNLLGASEGVNNKFLTGRQEVKRTSLCLITSDTGLCSSYNNNIIRATELFINQKDDLDLICVGKKGFSHFKRRQVNIAESFLDTHGRYSDDFCSKLLDILCGSFLTGSVDEVYFAYTHYQSALRHEAVIEKFLNIPSKPSGEIDYIFEPDMNSVLKELIPIYMFNKVKFILMNSFCAEHSARMIAMGESTKNAKDLLDELVLLRNKQRQAAITKDMLEISSAAEVLR